MNPEGITPPQELVKNLRTAEKEVQRAAAAFSDPNKVYGPSGESNEEELRTKLQKAIRERQRAQARLDEQKTLH